jgi:hypothetical protein
MPPRYFSIIAYIGRLVNDFVFFPATRGGGGPKTSSLIFYLDVGKRQFCMYLKKSKRKNGRVYLSVADGCHDPQKGHSRTVSVKKIGYLDDFLDLYDDPVAH